MVIRVLVLAVALAASTAAGARAAQPFIPLLQPGDTVPAIALSAQDGRPFSLAALRGSAVAVSFIYTRCADARMCPLVSAKFSRAQSAIGAAPIHLVTLTLDPAFDTAPVLARYGRAFAQNPRYWTLATGSTAAIEDLAGRLGIATSRLRPGLIVHTEGLVIIDPAGRVARTIYGNDWSPAEVVAAARATLPGSRDAFIGLRGWLSETMERCGGGNLALGGTAMLGLLVLSCTLVGWLFWLAFREKPAGGVPH